MECQCEDISIMSLCNDTEELEIFDTEAITSVISYKWDTFGRSHHLFGCILHLFYTFSFALYVIEGYLMDNSESTQRIYAILMVVGIIYPWVYDMLQLFRGGLENYVSDPWNFLDFLYIWGSIANCVLQITEGPRFIVSKLLMCIIVLFLILKTFFFLRIF